MAQGRYCLYCQDVPSRRIGRVIGQSHHQTSTTRFQPGPCRFRLTSRCKGITNLENESSVELDRAITILTKTIGTSESIRATYYDLTQSRSRALQFKCQAPIPNRILGSLKLPTKSPSTSSQVLRDQVAVVAQFDEPLFAGNLLSTSCRCPKTDLHSTKSDQVEYRST